MDENEIKPKYGIEEKDTIARDYWLNWIRLDEIDRNEALERLAGVSNEVKPAHILPTLLQSYLEDFESVMREIIAKEIFKDLEEDMKHCSWQGSDKPYLDYINGWTYTSLKEKYLKEG